MHIRASFAAMAQYDLRGKRLRLFHDDYLWLAIIDTSTTSFLSSTLSEQLQTMSAKSMFLRVRRQKMPSDYTRNGDLVATRTSLTMERKLPQQRNPAPTIRYRTVCVCVYFKKHTHCRFGNSHPTRAEGFPMTS